VLCTTTERRDELLGVAGCDGDAQPFELGGDFDLAAQARARRIERRRAREHEALFIPARRQALHPLRLDEDMTGRARAQPPADRFDAARQLTNVFHDRQAGTRIDFDVTSVLVGHDELDHELARCVRDAGPRL